MSLRLIAASQAGKDPHAGNIALTDPPPRFAGVDPNTLGGRGKWTIEQEEQTRYEQLFQVWSFCYAIAYMACTVLCQHSAYSNLHIILYCICIPIVTVE